jgi:poly(3-hydroxybutyrate) depolymerase
MTPASLILLLLSLLFTANGSKVDSDKVSKSMHMWKNGNKTPDTTPGQQQYVVNRPEGPRTFYAWVPKSYDGTTAFPVIFSFHGLGDDCLNFGPATGFQDLSETRNFLYVYPCGYPGLIGNAWNAGTCCNTLGNIDDVTFTKDMLALMVQNYNVDLNRVYVSGFSNGAMMAEILGCVAPDIFHATASVSGIVELEPGNSGGEDACSRAYSNFTQRVSTVNIHGDFDFVVPWTGDAILGFPDVPTNFADWSVRNNCQGSAVTTFSKGAYTESTYQHCVNGTTVRVVKHSGGGHEWPRDDDFDTPTYVVNFFYAS